MKMTARNHRTLSAILICLIFLTVCFIFANSMETVPESQKKSEGLLALIKPILVFLFGETGAEHFMLRKLAHFIEFFLLGAELCGLALLWKLPRSMPLLCGLIIALADETIQLFYDRGSQVQDVWLDFSAVVVTVALAYVIQKLKAAFGKDEP